MFLLLVVGNSKNMWFSVFVFSSPLFRDNHGIQGISKTFPVKIIPGTVLTHLELLAIEYPNLFRK